MSSLIIGIIVILAYVALGYMLFKEKKSSKPIINVAEISENSKLFVSVNMEGLDNSEILGLKDAIAGWAEVDSKKVFLIDSRINPKITIMKKGDNNESI